MLVVVVSLCNLANTILSIACDLHYYVKSVIVNANSEMCNVQDTCWKALFAGRARPTLTWFFLQSVINLLLRKYKHYFTLQCGI